jgi:energy-coupling factor transporter transmembrane protein EcfT
MLRVQPVVRLLSALMLAASIFGVTSLGRVLAAYIVVLLLVLLTGVTRLHARFVVFVSAPLLLALLVVWGWAASAKQIPLPHMSGIQYAVFCWLRIIAVGGILQTLFIPLIEQPRHLTDFLDRTRLRGAPATLIVASIVFLPEVRRRLDRIVDARKAQGHSLRGIRALVEVPQLLMPLVSSLLDSSSQRAELWSHRGILDAHGVSTEGWSYSGLQSTVALALSSAVSAAIFLS